MSTPLTAVSGIGPAAAGLLEKHGIATVEQLVQASIDDLTQVPGFGPARAATVLGAARDVLDGPAPAAKPAKQAKAGGKKKGKKKDKKKGKEKKRKKDGKRKRGKDDAATGSGGKRKRKKDKKKKKKRKSGKGRKKG